MLSRDLEKILLVIRIFVNEVWAGRYVRAGHLRSMGDGPLGWLTSQGRLARW